MKRKRMTVEDVEVVQPSPKRPSFSGRMTDLYNRTVQHARGRSLVNPDFTSVSAVTESDPRLYTVRASGGSEVYSIMNRAVDTDDVIHPRHGSSMAEMVARSTCMFAPRRSGKSHAIAEFVRRSNLTRRRTHPFGELRPLVISPNQQMKSYFFNSLSDDIRNYNFYGISLGDIHRCMARFAGEQYPNVIILDEIHPAFMTDDSAHALNRLYHEAGIRHGGYPHLISVSTPGGRYSGMSDNNSAIYTWERGASW